VMVLLILPLQLDLFSERSWWSLFAGNFLYGLVYANCCGWLAWLVMRNAASYMPRLTPVRRWGFLISSLIFVGVFGSLLALLILASVGIFPWSAYWPRFWGGLQIVLVISLVTGILWFIIETMRYRTEYAMTRARLAALEAKIQPHFLFNTLNSIAALIPENPAAAEKMTEQLAALLRSSLISTHEGTVALADEIKIVTDYLEIEKARFGPRLDYGIDIPRELMTRSVPPFSIQTLVENCVKYGGSEVRIAAREENGKLIVDVWDSGKGFTGESITPGHGLHNLRLRMALLWGAHATLDAYKETGGGRVRLTMPSVICG
jgi:hypothetical protein